MKPREVISDPRERGGQHDQIVVDGSPIALEWGRVWAEALGAPLTTLYRGPLGARLVVVDADHVHSWVGRTANPLLIARAMSRSRRILVALDLARPVEAVLGYVAALVRARPSATTLVHSIEVGVEAAEWMANFGGASAGFVAGDVEARWGAAANRLAELLRRYSFQGDVRVSDSPAARFILAVAAELQPELIALGAPRHFGLLHRTVAAEVAASTSVTVLVVPHSR
jgi:nucleotide-binding universal stress UspA family protein